MKLRALPALAGAALLALGLAACSGPADAAPGSDAPVDKAGGYAVDENTLVFGVVPDSVDTETNYQPLMDYIATKTGKEVEYHESTDYAALIEAAIAGKVDVASFSGFTYVTATNNGAKLTPISSIVTKEGQEPGYYSQAIAPKGSDVESIEDFAGKKVCFVDPSSTSGYLFPSYNLLDAGIDPEKGITPVFAGKHDVSVTKTGEGKECEVGFAEDSEVAKSDKVKVVAETMVPGAPLVYSNTLPDEVISVLTDSLAEVTIDDIIDAGVDSADSDAFRSVFYATKPVDDKYYDLIRDICKKTNATQCQG
ncbi:phosphate/phosphite/phosphonate ABC transporter substrate-binding protein [Microbacterium esteraromaticum]|uniref:phosphate/phosphite/phosphonate ABC transporter substrate-binding protein n=1 Tax=Microbacterium esteraromaticum TaxID=57043 RepID=UPI00195D49CC|nr:phosphate/phosphite/phosphonate ABC transporter substrate-binding protein [Microbacterium esteraromaticum]MBM7465500.1 phosphonate transport system substrate-binding protein [Microbacterium esteraromaticum]